MAPRQIEKIFKVRQNKATNLCLAHKLSHLPSQHESNMKTPILTSKHIVVQTVNRIKIIENKPPDCDSFIRKPQTLGNRAVRDSLIVLTSPISCDSLISWCEYDEHFGWF